VSQATAGAMSTIYVLLDGTVFSCGDNTAGQLGIGTYEQQLLPIKVMDSIRYVTAEGSTTLAIGLDGTLFGWGSNNYGQLLEVNPAQVIKPVKLMENISNAASNEYATYAVDRDGTLYLFGSGVSGQLGMAEQSVYQDWQTVIRPLNGKEDQVVLRIGSEIMFSMGAMQEVDPGRGTVPLLLNSTTMLPLRAVVEAFGGSISYDDQERCTTVLLDGHKLEMWVDKAEVELDDLRYTVNPWTKSPVTAPQIINERTYIHIRSVEFLGLTVTWQQGEQTIFIE